MFKGKKSNIVSLKKRKLQNQIISHLKTIVILSVCGVLIVFILYFDKIPFDYFKKSVKESEVVQENKVLRSVTNQVTNKRILPGLFLNSYYHFDASTTDVSTSFKVDDVSKKLSPMSLRIDLFHNSGPNKIINIRYTSLNINREKNQVFAMLDFTTFGNPQLSKSTDSFIGQGYCIGDLVRGDKDDNDKLTCNGLLQKNIVTRVTHQVDKNLIITFKVIGEELVGYFSSLEGVQTELGRFSLEKSLKLQNQIVVSLSSLEPIRECSELNPVEVSILSVTNKGIVPNQVQLKKDTKFECSKKTNEVKLNNNVVKFTVR